ncbi:MAG: SufD family Fe-S cluster assembly protein [Thermoplasmatales archaeon]|nr:SufD family Fe-S cluster assembly protein [Thermoplasmatales archaeon]
MKHVEKALTKKAAHGPDVDITKYEMGPGSMDAIDDLGKAPRDLAEKMGEVGVVTDEGARDGSLLIVNNAVGHCSLRVSDGMELMPLDRALEKYDGLKDHMWKLVEPDKDKFTATAYTEKATGYFIRIKEGHHIKNPIQTCMMIGKDRSIQNLHNIIVVEKGASCEIITGCATGNQAGDSLHIGISEFYVKEGGSLTYSMIHSWGSGTVVRPRTGVKLEKNARFTNNYVILHPVGTMQSAPVVHLDGEGASCRLNTVCLAHKGSDVDTGGTVYLNAPDTSAEIISRSITKGGRMVARGRLVGNVEKVRAHLECRSIVLDDGGVTLAIPELETKVADVEMTHEAAVGKVERDKVEYLMSRGLTEEQAVGMIIRGFLVGGIRGLPEELERDIDEAIEQANLGD